MQTLTESHDAAPASGDVAPKPVDGAAASVQPAPAAADAVAAGAALAEPTALPVETDAAPLRFTLHPRVPTLWFIQSVVAVVVFSLAGALIAIGMGWWLALLAIVLADVLVVRLVGHYGRRYLATFRCELLDDGLRVARGVWWRSETFVPRARIQHTDVSEGPIARRFGIATLKVYTAGTHVGEIGVEGLARADAFALRDRLLGRTGHDAL
jgi:hypothetical protein